MRKAKEKNLTEGSILSSLINLSVPIILANALQSMYQLIDTFWLGRIGANAVAAVSLSFPILFLILSLGAGLTLAGSVIVAQAKGAKNQRDVNYSSSQTVFVIFFLSILLSFITFHASEPLMKLIGAGPEVLDDSVIYFKYSSFGFVFLFMFFVFQSLMRGIGNVWLPMYIVLGTVLLNLVLDPLFIFGYGSFEGMGVAGAAIASVITQGVSAIVGIGILFKGKRGIKIKWPQMKWDFAWTKKMFALGIPSSLEQSARAGAMTMLVVLVTSFGSEVVAAYGIGVRVLSLIVIPALGFSIATTTLVGQNVGANQIGRAEKVGDLSAKIAFFGLTGIGVLLYIFAEPITAFFVPNDPQVIQDSALFIQIMGPSFGLLGLQQVLNGVFNGAGFTKVSLLISIFSLWMIRFPVAYLLSNNTSFDEIGLWWSFPISNFMAAIVGFIYYKSGHWKGLLEKGKQLRRNKL
ncbi:MATE family efflux transporter [Brumimicrobium aurantiacum]|uniref:Multidrug-efflux transporter n=1 Tax=Brumimicrobium aurantiacum TaxID=1737063 RepID=A0A3E1EYK4_9FLAO|nr:MATE family efflux transporter [Brumimicrobium aurantiacum]RFC54624.1 MATE family efflux transporter [Brumimicrobium aurantiacum]